MGRQLVPSSMVYDTPLGMTAEDAFSTLTTRTGKNLMINGDFSIWQRGDSQSTTGYGSADRWYLGFTGGSFSLAKGAITPGSYDFLSDLDGTPSSIPMLTVSGQTASNHCAYIIQAIEDVYRVSNRQVTVSFTCLLASIGYVSIELMQIFGTTGSPSEYVSVQAQKVALSQGRITATFDVPGLSNKTITVNSSLRVVIWLSGGSDFNARLDGLGLQNGYLIATDFQAEVGPIATGFDRRLIAEELALCQRYYERYQAGSSTYYTFAMYATSVCELQRIQFAVPKRVNPTITATFTPHLAPGTMGTLYNMRAYLDSFQPTYNWTSGVAGYAGHGAMSWYADAELF